MSPRHYELGQRQAVIDESRRRVLDAARELLAGPPGYPAFTVDAVARRADVARATVYYQFRSKTGLLEAVCDDLAEAGQISDLPRAFAEPDPRVAVHRLISVFAGFWAVDRVVMRRLRALAALDPDVHAVITARDERRRQGLEVLVGRAGTAGDPGQADAVRALLALTSFETFDTLAGPGRDLGEAVPLVTGLADAVLASLASSAGPAGPGAHPR
jgi:AcrR family transcriptional regulator